VSATPAGGAAIASRAGEIVGALPPRGSRRRKRSRVARTDPWTVAILMSPWVIGFALFLIYPMVASLFYSFTRYDILSPPQWVGLLNYRYMFTKDPYFWTAVGNTVWMIVLGVPIKVLFSVVTAVILTRPRKGLRVYRTMVFLPSMVPAVAATLGFVFLMSPKNGPINQLLRLIGIQHPPAWFFNPTWSKPALLVLALWGIGDGMLVYLAGLLDVPRHLHEAASIEGAGAWQRFRYVTLPMISPVIFFSLVTGVIDSFQYFTEAYVASSAASGQSDILGTPQGSTLFYSTWLYKQGFSYFHMGYASALAWILFAVTMACTLVIIKTSNRWVFYQGGGGIIR